MKVLLYVSCALLCFEFVSSTKVECTFKVDDFLGMGNIYYCEFKRNINIISPESAYIEFSSGAHWDAKTNDDVLGIDANDKNIKYFPKGLNVLFKNLKAIDIENGRIKDLYQSDLRPYKNLAYLDLGNNDIEVLEDGIFDYNPHLQVISFFGNKLYHIDTDVFDGLSNLNYLVLDKNRCIDKSARFDSAGVMNVIQNTKALCQNAEFLKGRSLQQRRC